MATGRVNIGGSGGGLNIYCQLNEPRTKDGIWIKKDAKIKKIVQDNVLWFAGEWNDPQKLHLADIPTSVLYRHCVAVNDKVYFFGTSDTNSARTSNTMFVYDIKDDTWTQSAAIPSSGMGWYPILIGTDIYLSVGAYAGGAYAATLYKFDTINSTWTKLDSTLLRYGTIMVPTSDGRYIYGIGSTVSTNGSNTLKKYDVASNTWTQIMILPHDMGDGSTAAFIIGGYLYYFGRIYTQNSSMTRHYGKINLTTLEHTALGEAPMRGGATYPIFMNEEIHFYTGSTKYIYSIKDDVFTLVQNATPMYVLDKDVLFYKGNIYVFGGAYRDSTGTNTKTLDTRRMSMTSKIFNEGTVVLLKFDDYLGGIGTEFVSPSPRPLGEFTRFVSYLDNVYMYVDGTLQESLETYYGNGEQWIKFKGEG